MHASRPAPVTASASPLSPELAILDDDVEFTRFTRQTLALDGRHMAESSLRIGGMHCAACASSVDSWQDLIAGDRLQSM